MKGMEREKKKVKRKVFQDGVDTKVFWIRIVSLVVMCSDRGLYKKPSFLYVYLLIIESSYVRWGGLKLISCSISSVSTNM